MPAQAIIFSKERLFCGQGVGTLKEAERLPRSIVVTLQDNSWFLRLRFRVSKVVNTIAKRAPNPTIAENGKTIYRVPMDVCHEANLRRRFIGNIDHCHRCDGPSTILCDHHATQTCSVSCSLS